MRSCVHGAGSCASTHVDGRRRASVNYLRGEQAGSRSSRGVWPPPPRRAPGSRAVPDPFAPFPSARCFLSSGNHAALRAKPRPGCFSPRRGFAAQCGAGERGAPLAGRERGSTPRSCSNRIGDALEHLRSRGRCHAPCVSVWAEGLHEPTASAAQTAVIQEDKGRESVATAAHTSGVFGPLRIAVHERTAKSAEFTAAGSDVTPLGSPLAGQDLALG